MCPSKASRVSGGLTALLVSGPVLHFKQVDVFTDVPYRGNPVAVVFVEEEPETSVMQRFAHWTNLSETTFVLPPTTDDADYRVRIFTPGAELPFAGHPTIGTCHAWLEAGGQPQVEGQIIQECGLGLITLRRDGDRIAFAAPELLRSGPVGESELADCCEVLGIERSDIVDAQWADNGPGWIAIMLGSASDVVTLSPNFAAVESYDIGVVGPYPVGVVAETEEVAPGAPAIEVRAFFRAGGVPTEDPVTGSLNAALAQWLLGNGTLEAPYVASQGQCLGRAGRVHISEADGHIWGWWPSRHMYLRRSCVLVC